MKKIIAFDISHNEEENLIGTKAVVKVLPVSSIDDERYRIDEAIKLIRQLLEKGVDVRDIIVLSRFNRILRKSLNIVKKFH